MGRAPRKQIGRASNNNFASRSRPFSTNRVPGPHDRVSIVNQMRFELQRFTTAMAALLDQLADADGPSTSSSGNAVVANVDHQVPDENNNHH